MFPRKATVTLTLLLETVCACRWNCLLGGGGISFRVRQAVEVGSLHMINKSLKASFPPERLCPAACAEEFSGASYLEPGRR